METSLRACVLLVLVMAVVAITGQGAVLVPNETDASRSLTSKYKPPCLAFKKLGYGYCREKFDDHGNPIGNGNYKLYRGVHSEKECAELCYEYGYCTGYEYDSFNHRCEVHRGEVGAYEPKDGVVCYQAYKTTKWKYCYKPPISKPDCKYKFKPVGHGYCREGYDNHGVPYGMGTYKLYCDDHKPCPQKTCWEACAKYHWCHFYEFTKVKPHELPHGAERGAGRCELHKSYIASYEPFRWAWCYEKVC